MFSGKLKSLTTENRFPFLPKLKLLQPPIKPPTGEVIERDAVLCYTCSVATAAQSGDRTFKNCLKSA